MHIFEPWWWYEAWRLIYGYIEYVIMGTESRP